jgi:hypothetical protein
MGARADRHRTGRFGEQWLRRHEARFLEVELVFPECQNAEQDRRDECLEDEQQTERAGQRLRLYEDDEAIMIDLESLLAETAPTN